jgi:antitoxin component YwqK of YwqJK toxin-antitoxin module
MEYGIKNGHMHGMMYTWSSRDDLHSAEPYRNGLAHGTALQWSQRNPNRIIGKYTMKRGTGINLWWQYWPFRLHLSEVFYLKEGQPHGFEWWIRENQKALLHERHWKNGKFHGIERQWNNKGKLHRGYPKYFVEGKQLTKSKYIAACGNDETLPLFRKADNDPKRIFPPEIRKHLKYKRRSHLRK